MILENHKQPCKAFTKPSKRLHSSRWINTFDTQIIFIWSLCCSQMTDHWISTFLHHERNFGSFWNKRCNRLGAMLPAFDTRLISYSRNYPFIDFKHTQGFFHWKSNLRSLPNVTATTKPNVSSENWIFLESTDCLFKMTGFRGSFLIAIAAFLVWIMHIWPNLPT